MRRRNAFTIVELLVAMALVMFIMAILSTAFATATKTFRNLKAIGDMANKLRAVTTILQRDLGADHFEGKKRLSDPNFWLSGPPTQGYFRIWHGSMPSAVAAANNYCYIEGTDIDTINSYRSVNHMLAFTIKLNGDQMSDFLTAGPNGGGTMLGTISSFGPQEARYQMPNTYNFQWADVAWFLQPQIDPNTGIQDNAGIDPVTGLPLLLYTLYRGQHVAVPDNNLVTLNSGGTGYLITVPNPYLEISCWPNTASGYFYFNSPTDLTVPSRRFGMSTANAAGVPYTPTTYGLTYPTLTQQGATGNLINADVQTTDVISFDVRVLAQSNIGTPVIGTINPIDPFVSLFEVATTYNNNNPAFPGGTGAMVFDTWSSLSDGSTSYKQWNIGGQHTSVPLYNASGPIIKAVQVTIRVWDFKTQQTREVTIVQAM